MLKDPAQPLRALDSMEDAQSSLQVMGLSAVTRTIFLLRTFLPSITRNAPEEHDTLREWALASVIAGDEAGAAGLASPDKVRADNNLYRRQRVLGSEALHQSYL